MIVKSKREGLNLNEACNQAMRWYCYGEHNETHHHNTFNIAASVDQPRIVEGVIPSSPMVFEEGLYGTA